jgi:hypothetical protein
MNDSINDYLNKKRSGQLKVKKTYCSFIKLDDGLLAEQIVNPDPAFAVFDPKKDTFIIQPTVQIGNKYLYPLDGDLVTKGVIRFSRKPEEYGDTETLRQEIKKFIHRYVDIHSFYEELASYYVLLTWLFDKNSAITYLGIFGEFGSGKTRAAQTIGSLCYKPVFVSGAITCAPIYRILELARGTLVINEFDFNNSDMGIELIKILNNGFERGMSVLRAKRDTGDVEAFDAFSPKIFTYRKKKNDQAFESRLITIPIEETTREDIPILLPQSFEEEAASIRDKLLLFRFRNFDKKSAVDLSIFNGIERRMRQTLYPLLTVIDDKKFLQTLTGFLNDIQEQQRVDRGMSWVAEHLQNLVNLTCEDKKDITCQQLADKYNLGDFKYKITAKKAGSIIRNDFKLKTERITSGENKGQTRIVLNAEKIKALCLRFSVDIPKESSLSSPSSPQVQPQSEDSEDSEDSSDNERIADSLNSGLSQLTDEEVIRQEKVLHFKLSQLEKNSSEYANLYNQWFTLRAEGEKRGLWGFIPSTNE